MPMETDTIEFAATESGDWFFHCHVLYHMMSGMGRIFSYENSPPNPEILNPSQSLQKVYEDDREFHTMARVGLESNGSDGELMFSNTRWQLKTEWRLGLNDKDGYESETHLGYFIDKNQFLLPYIGVDIRYRNSDELESSIFGQTNTKNNRQIICLGIQYTLPFFIKADARIDYTGKFRIQLSREDIALTDRLRFNFMVNTDREYLLGARFILAKWFSLSTHYDSDMKFGAGVTLTY
jgi:hypothetical protein